MSLSLEPPTFEDHSFDFDFKIEPTIDLDDAFSDKGDDEEDLHFSAASAREALANNLGGGLGSPEDEPDEEDEERDFVDTVKGVQNGRRPEDSNASISTLDIGNKSAHTSPASPLSRSDSGPQLSDEQLGQEGSIAAMSAELDNVDLGPSTKPTNGSTPSPDEPESPIVFAPTLTTHSHTVSTSSAASIVNGMSAEERDRIAPFASQSGPSPPSEPQRQRAVSMHSAVARTKQHHPMAGPSALEKVVSKTRPHFLPPKQKAEDRKHLADWETMMKQSRALEEKKRKAQVEKRLAHERMIEEVTIIWEKEILPDWKAAVRDPRLRKLWWKGIPPKLRGTVWEKAVGNALALSKDTFRTCLARAKRALASGSFPTTTLNLIENDIKTTLPALHLFTPHVGPLYEDLNELLRAWVVARSDEGLGYVTGASKIAAMFLLNMPAPNAFVCMRNLLERHCMRSFYGGLQAKDDVEAYYRIFDTLLADGMPKIYFNFKQHQISPSLYLPDWCLPLFLDHLPLDACARIWDVLLLEGDAFFHRAALAMLGVLEPRLFFPDREQLLVLLRGENKAALEVARREGAILNGAKYEIYGIDESLIWARIEEMDEWWRESTWQRLIQRELPDI